MANDWIKWEGWECPVEDGTLVDVEYSDGEKSFAMPANRNKRGSLRDAGPAFWRHDGAGNDIIAYRLHQPESVSTSALQSQEGGDHYKKLAIQPMEYSMANKLDACQHTVVKYVTRFRDKGGIEDLKKAIHTIKLLAKLEYDEEL